MSNKTDLLQAKLQAVYNALGGDEGITPPPDEKDTLGWWLDMIIQQLANGTGGAVVPDDYFFDDESARDTYFSAHPEELKDSVLCCTNDPVALWKWNGTEWKDSSSWVKGPKGDKGNNIEIQNNGTYIQWRVVGSDTWNNLVDISSLTGKDGDSVDIQIDEGYIQWKHSSDEIWKNLIALSLLKGEDGVNGISIIWKGDLSDPPENPELNWVYYDITQKKSFIHNGTSWDIMTQDGKDGTNEDARVGNLDDLEFKTDTLVEQANHAYGLIGGELEYLELQAESLIDEANKLLHQIGSIFDLPYPDLVTASNAVEKKADANTADVAKKLGRQTKYDNGDWEMWSSESDGGGHWFWTKATNTLAFEGFNNDPTDTIVWERYIIDGGGDNFVTSGGTRVGSRLIVAWDGGSRDAGKTRFYYTVGNSTSAFTADDEVSSHVWVRALLAGELGRPLPAVATHADMLALTIQHINDWLYVWDDTYDPGTGNIHVGETWAYAYDGSNWVDLVRINEVQIQDDDTTITLDAVSGRRKVKEGGIGATQLATGAATDNIIGNRTLADQTGSATLVTIDAKNLTAWLQGIRNNLKALFSGKQDALISGENIKTVGGRSILGTGDLTIGIPLPYKGASNQAGILIDLGAAIANGVEILFDLLYNETQSGNPVRQVHIHGQIYAEMNRSGMVQNGNVPVAVYAFKGTVGGIGNTNTYFWIPNSNTAYFPSVKAEMWAGLSEGLFSALPLTISTIPAAPSETLTKIVQL
jgi:hypothetical protein